MAANTAGLNFKDGADAAEPQISPCRYPLIDTFGYD